MPKETLRERLKKKKMEIQLRQFGLLIPKGDDRDNWFDAQNKILQLTQEFANSGIPMDKLDEMIKTIGVLEAKEVGNTNIKIPKKAMTRKQIKTEAEKAGLSFSKLQELNNAVKTKNELLKKHKSRLEKRLRR